MSSNAASFFWMSVLTALCVYSDSLTAGDPRPGVRARITQRGLDYGSELAVNLLMKNKERINLNNMYISVAGSSMVISDMVIRHLPRPHLRMSLVPNNTSPIGRLRADVTQLHPIVDANMRISYRTWMFSTSRAGSITATGRNLSIMLEAALDADDAGRPLPRDLRCRAAGDVHIELTGQFRRWSRLFGLVYRTLRSRLKPTIFRELCANVKRDVMHFITSELINVPMSVELDDGFVLDYRLTQSPLITNQFIESSHKGEIFVSSSESSGAPFNAPVIPALTQLMHKMVYVYVTDYVANSGWFSALVNGKLATTVDQNTTSVPESTRRFLLMSCPGSSCLGSVFPRLALLYPNSAASVNIHVSNSSSQWQFVALRGRAVLASTRAVAEIFVQTATSRDHVLTVNLTAVCGMDLRFANNKLLFQVNRFDLRTDIQRNSLHLMTSFAEMLFDSFIGMTSQMVVLPMLQVIGSQGVPLIFPSVPELRLINPVIVSHNITGVMIIGTDVLYHVPAANSTTTE